MKKIAFITALAVAMIATSAAAREVSAVSVSRDVIPGPSLKGTLGAECRPDDAGKGEACTVTLGRNPELFRGLLACESQEGDGLWGIQNDGSLIPNRVRCQSFDGNAGIPAVRAGYTAFWASPDSHFLYWMGRN